MKNQIVKKLIGPALLCLCLISLKSVQANELAHLSLDINQKLFLEKEIMDVLHHKKNMLEINDKLPQHLNLAENQQTHVSFLDLLAKALIKDSDF